MRLLAAFALATTSFVALATAGETPSQSSIRLAQAASCSAWNQTCYSRCKDDACRKSNCGPKLTACLKSGCWTEGAGHGGAQHCGLAKQ